MTTPTVTAGSSASMVRIQPQDVVCCGSYRHFHVLQPGNITLFHVLHSEYQNYQNHKLCKPSDLQIFYGFIVDCLANKAHARFIMTNILATTWTVMSRDEALHVVALAFEGFGEAATDKGTSMPAAMPASENTSTVPCDPPRFLQTIALPSVAEAGNQAAPLFLSLDLPSKSTDNGRSPENGSDQQTFPSTAMQESTPPSQLRQNELLRRDDSSILDSFEFMPEGSFDGEWQNLTRRIERRLPCIQLMHGEKVAYSSEDILAVPWPDQRLKPFNRTFPFLNYIIQIFLVIFASSQPLPPLFPRGNELMQPRQFKYKRIMFRFKHYLVLPIAFPSEFY